MNNTSHQYICPRVYARVAWLCLCLTLLGALSTQAQITFTAAQLPTAIGNYIEEYVSTNANPSTIIGPTGGPQVWDFSQAQQPEEIVRRVDIVPPADGGQQASFPNAAYAERYIDEPNDILEWDYYSLTNSIGRYYFGSYAPDAGASVFSPPAIDIPTMVGYGTNWSYTVNTTLETITEQDSVSATVDAFGTVILPQLGSFPALRVNQLTTTKEFIGNTLFNTFYIREYYWLVPGFDKAVHIVSQVSSTPPPANFTSAYEIRRVFAVYSVSLIPSPVGSLRISLQKDSAILDWLAASNASAYQVQAVGDLTLTNWQILASPASNSWSEPVTTTQRFYRVFIEP